jgi:hypothetical protein
MEMYNFVFHYNHHDDLWYAIHRDRWTDYWNGERENKQDKPIYFSTKMKDLVYLIQENESTDLRH